LRDGLWSNVHIMPSTKYPVHLNVVDSTEVHSHLAMFFAMVSTFPFPEPLISFYHRRGQSIFTRCDYSLSSQTALMTPATITVYPEES
jgi:hypothetical protein